MNRTSKTLCIIILSLVLTVLFSSTSFSTSCLGTATEVAMDTSKKLPTNTLLFFCCGSAKLMSEEIKYVEDERGNRIALVPIELRKINTEFEQFQHPSGFAIFKPTKELEKNTKYTIRYPYPESYHKPIMSRVKNEPKLKEWLDSFVFETGSKRAISHREIVKIKRVKKKYIDFHNNSYDREDDQQHSFIADKELKAPFYLVRIKRKRSGVVDTIVKRPLGRRTIYLSCTACGGSYYFAPGEKYQIQIAPMNYAGEVGDFTRPFKFRSAALPASTALLLHIRPYDVTEFLRKDLPLILTGLVVLVVLIIKVRRRKKQAFIQKEK